MRRLAILSLLCAWTTGAAVNAPVVSLPFDLVRRHIMLPVVVGADTRLNFMLDTGDKYAVIDRDRARELRLPLGGKVHVKGSAAMSEGAMVQSTRYRIPGLHGFSQPVVLTFPLTSLEKRLGARLDGIIGADFIREYVVEIDYAARVLRLHDRGFEYQGGGEAIPLRFNSGGHPIFESVVKTVQGDVIAGELVLDLGAGHAVMLRTPVVDRYKLTSGNAKTIPLLGGAGVGGSSKGRLGRVASVRVGRVELKNPIAVFAQDSQGDHSNTDTIGSVGQELMSRFRIFLDYRRNRMILEPVASFDAPFDRAVNGLVVDAEGADLRTFRISEVTPDTPAERSGAKPGDFLTSLDGKPAIELTLTQIYDALERRGTHKLGVKRGSEAFQLTLVQAPAI